MTSMYKQMIRKLVLFYAYVAIALILTMNAYNAFIDGAPWSHIFTFDFYYVTIGHALIFLLFVGFTIVQLRKVKQYFLGIGTSKAEALQSLMRFPYALGIFFSFLVVCYSAIYHYIEIVILRFQSFDMIVIRHLVIEFSAGVILALIYIGVARIYVTPCAKAMAKTNMQGIKFSSFFWHWLATFASLFLVIGLLLIWSVFNWDQRGSVSLLNLLLVSLFLFLFGVGVVRMLMIGILQDIRALVEAMNHLHHEDDAHQIIPVATRDETGQLAEAFNELQKQIVHEYESIHNELKMAYEVQRYILPVPEHSIGQHHIVCHSEAALEVGGDLYDVLHLSDQHFVIMIGDVSGKGMPAALVMSAVISLFRTEATRGGNAGDILTRINRQLSTTLQGRMMVTIGIALVDKSIEGVSYASAGHLAPYILTSEAVQRVKVSSLPIGFSPEEVYQEQLLTLSPGNYLILLTDGIIERVNSYGEMFGFERLEEALAELDLVSGPVSMLESIQKRLSMYSDSTTMQSQANIHDDWTILFVQRLQEGEKPDA